MTLIAASRLSKCIVGASHVEYVVDDLEQHAQLGGETAKRDCRRSIPIPPNSSTHSTDAPIRRPVFSSCTGAAAGRARPGVRGLTSAYCPPTIPFTPVAAASSAAALSTRSGAERWSVSRWRNASAYSPSPGEDRHVLAELHVAGRLPAAQLVVVHRRQVVVDQRVGVDQLDRARQRQHLALLAARPRAPSPARAPAGCACRRPAASSASPPPAPPSAPRRRSASPAGSARPPRAGARGSSPLPRSAVTSPAARALQQRVLAGRAVRRPRRA